MRNNVEIISYSQNKVLFYSKIPRVWYVNSSRITLIISFELQQKVSPFFTAETRQLHIEQAKDLAPNYTQTHWERLSLSAWWRTEYKPDGYLLFHPTFQNALEGRCYLLGFSQFILTPSISLGLYSCPRHFNKQTKSHLSCESTGSVCLFLSSCEVLKGCSYAN